jgi:hypothetical protein
MPTSENTVVMPPDIEAIRAALPEGYKADKAPDGSVVLSDENGIPSVAYDSQGRKWAIRIVNGKMEKIPIN